MSEKETKMGGPEKKTNPRANNPTFSSILLDEIYRSMAEDDLSVKVDRQRDGDVMTLRKACLVEKWMEGKVRDKVTTLEKRNPPMFTADVDRDSLIFTSSSSCSDTSSGCLSSDSDWKALPSSYDLGKRPNPIRTSRPENPKKITPRQVLSENPSVPVENVVKQKSRASTIYDNLKKVKQPISPGGKLSSFINSLRQATKQSAKSRVGDDSVCSSASSFPRSCIGNERSAKTMLGKEAKRNMFILPRCVVVKEHKNMCPHEDGIKIGQRPGGRRECSSARYGEETIAALIRSSKLETVRARGGDHCSKYKKCGDVSVPTAEEDDIDALSCTSSDLFELDHITYVGRYR